MRVRCPRWLALTALRMLAAGAAVAAAVCGCGDESRAPLNDSARPHVILISLDTLRADALAPWRGDARSIAPNLDALASESVVFSSSFVPMPFTLPSHISMLTGVHPEAHGVSGKDAVLSKKLTTLTETLRAAGYRTQAWVGNDWLDPDFGFGRGFEGYDYLAQRLSYASEIRGRVLEYAQQMAPSGDPFFLFIHFMDPHSDTGRRTRNQLPYFSPPAFRRDIRVGEAEFCAGPGKCATEYLLEMDEEREALPDAKIAKIRALYEAGIRHLDQELGTLFAELRRLGIYDQSLIVVTSDHGEEFREHGLFIHSQVYDETIAVPLLIRFPGGANAGRRVEGLAELLDILPTILDYLNLEIPEYAQGESLLPYLDERRAAVPGPVLAQDKLQRSVYALRTPDDKLVYDVSTQRAQLFDLASDPEERRDLSEARPERVRELRQQLEELLEKHAELARIVGPEGPGDTSALDAEARNRLKEIGYLQEE
jgi:arylsulfatase A-like enzyme